ncbi:MAG: NAD(P)/FAD-dependent oxidoreductase [Tsuneonella sp.]
MSDTKAGMPAVDVAIIGAGPAGLTAGYLLASAGKRVAIIEKDPVYVGGISRTVIDEGFRIDIGGHNFASENPAVTALWEELLPGGFTTRPRLSRIYFEGKFYTYPLRPVEALRQLGPARAAAFATSYLGGKARRSGASDSFEGWAIDRFGERLYATFFKPYAEKVWGIACAEMSADWGAQRVRDRSLWSAITRPRRETIRYPRLGPGMVWEAARDRIAAMGGMVLMGHALDQLAADGESGWRLSAAGANGKVVIAAGHVVSSAPMRELAARMHPLPAATWSASKLKYRDFITVALRLAGADPFPDHWIYVHDDRVKVGRVQNFRAWSPEMAPAGTASLGLEYFCSEGDALWSLDNDALIALATRELAALGLASPDRVIGGTVVRQEKAYPVYDAEYAANVAAMRAELESRHPTLHLVGRNGMHRYDSQDHAMTTAMLTVENILAGARVCDAWNFAEAAEPPALAAPAERRSAPLPIAAEQQPHQANAARKAA